MHKKYKQSDKQEAKEPDSVYRKNLKFRHYTSFEEMNEGDAMEVAKFTPEEHLMHVTEMIQLFYAEELKKPFNKTIHFK